MLTPAKLDSSTKHLMFIIETYQYKQIIQKPRELHRLHLVHWLTALLQMSSQK